MHKMSKTNTTDLNYRSLLLSTIKEKSTSFTLGVVVVLLISSIGLSLARPKLRPLLTKVPSKETGDIKGNKTSPGKKIRTYTVQSGDQLFLIAEKIYGSGFNMQDIMATNKITNPDQIEVGQKLIIPDVKSRFPTEGIITETAAKTGRVSEKSEKYVVKEGDDLAKIALQTYGDSYSWVKIAETNNLLNPDDLRVGMILIIPK